MRENKTIILNRSGLLLKPVRLNHMRKLTVIIFFVIVLGAFVGYQYYNKPHRSVEDAEYVETDAVSLFNSFESDELNGNQKYLDKVVMVKGVVSEILSNQDGKTVILLNTGDPIFGISCTMSEAAGNVKAGMNVTIKGICTGYLSDVVITEGIVMEGDPLL